MKRTTSNVGRVAKRYYELSAAIRILEKQKETTARDLISMSMVAQNNPSVELLSSQHRVLVSYIKSCVVPRHVRDAHIKITRCDERDEYIARNNKQVKQFATIEV